MPFNNPIKSFRNKRAAGATAEVTSKESISTEEMASSSSTHSENHNKIGDYMRDAILGFADGLTVPFALTAGLSAYVN
jgi:hypothetical protein